MCQIFKSIAVLVTLLLVSACAVIHSRDSAVTKHALAIANSHPVSASGGQQCKQALSLTSSSNDSEMGSGEIELLIWNIKKGDMKNWREDLESLAANKDLLLLQEVRLNMQSASFLGKSGYWVFAPGYTSNDAVTGVATLSRVAPITQCSLVAYEPWLGTPKATSVTEYALSNTDSTLLVVNTHMINFTLGLEAFRGQLGAVAEILETHSGPVIYSGDFNTWHPARYRALEEFMTDLELVALEFEEDHRVRFFGSRVDHVFVRGLNVKAANTHQRDSSDHNPLSITLSL